MGMWPIQLHRIPCLEGLGFMLYCCHLEALKIFEQEVLQLHFALGPSNYVANHRTELIYYKAITY